MKPHCLLPTLLISWLFLSAKLAANSDASFMLVCKWDDAREQEAIPVLGAGRRREGDYLVIEDHLTDFIHIAEYRVDRETGEVDAVPSFLAVFNRWTGRVNYLEGKETRHGTCQKANKRLF